MRKFLSNTVLTLMGMAAGGVLLASLIINYRAFINLEGLFIVVGGSIANAFLSYQREDVLKAFATIRALLKKSPPGRDRLHKDIMQLIIWSYIVHERGLLDLEKEAGRTVNDPLRRYGIDLVVTGYPAEKIREMLHTVTDTEFEQRCLPVAVLRNMAATAPAFGMVGTLIGMVMLFRHVGADISSIGSGMAVAMLATLYGILMARLICLPAADSLLQKEEAQRARNDMLTEGFAMLAEKQNPYYMLDRLNSFLEPSKHFEFNLGGYKQLANRQAAAA